jgi:hypothetical protein
VFDGRLCSSCWFVFVGETRICPDLFVDLLDIVEFLGCSEINNCWMADSLGAAQRKYTRSPFVQCCSDRFRWLVCLYFAQGM